MALPTIVGSDNAAVVKPKLRGAFIRGVGALVRANH